ncbi:Solute carrier family 12 member 1 [Araneus ventricosus]|uniref:Solute carrier family 12 member 1 n=1 Tax=Araneus ventricosus TaxID=182803 RepID=A0A4Y2IKN8_ARAVE|nr:Solute carrier family 12 member 1 [Araneus ventricosus]
MIVAFGPDHHAGSFAATLSSARPIVSAPRILQALCVDGIIPWLNWFGKGYGKDNDPRRALALTFVIAVVFTVIGDLNAVAPIISNFFMAANGLINFSCFHASYVKSPGFRPGFRYYNLWLSLLGALLCVVIMFVMNWITALVTDVVVIALYIYIAKTCPEINWGSSFQGYSYRNALHYLNKLTRIEEHVKNYRPAILVLSGNTGSRPQLVDFAEHLTKDIGLQICAHISKEPLNWKTRCLLQELNTRWLMERRVKAFYSLVEADSFENGVASLIQTAGVGKMRPNILLMGFKDNWQTCDIKESLDYFHAIHQAVNAHLSLCILRIPGGTDYSPYYETPDGLPILQSYDSKGKVETSLKSPVDPSRSTRSKSKDVSTKHDPSTALFVVSRQAVTSHGIVWRNPDLGFLMPNRDIKKFLVLLISYILSPKSPKWLPSLSPRSGVNSSIPPAFPFLPL